MQMSDFSMNNSILSTEHFLIFFKFLTPEEDGEKSTPILYKVSDYVLAMSSTCYVLGQSVVDAPF